MDLVSNNAPREIEASRAEEEARFLLRQLTANLMRVTRGSGNPWLILDHVLELANAATRYYELTNRWPDLGDVLSVDDPRCVNPERPENHATDAMLRGALQMVASRLLGQKAQEAAGSSELLVNGVHRWADAVGFRAAAQRQQNQASRRIKSKSSGWDEVFTYDWQQRVAAEEAERKRLKKLTPTERITLRRARAEALGRVRPKRESPKR